MLRARKQLDALALGNGVAEEIATRDAAALTMTLGGTFPKPAGNDIGGTFPGCAGKDIEGMLPGFAGKDIGGMFPGARWQGHSGYGRPGSCGLAP